MTDKTKRVLSKLHLSALYLSFVIAVLTTFYCIVCQIHDTFARIKAAECVSKVFDQEYKNKYGRELQHEKDGSILNSEFQQMLDLEDSQEYKTTRSFTCNADKYGDRLYTNNTWYSSQYIYDKGFSSDRSEQLMILIFVWFIPFVLIGFKKWTVWLIK